MKKLFAVFFIIISLLISCNKNEIDDDDIIEYRYELFKEIETIILGTDFKEGATIQAPNINYYSYKLSDYEYYAPRNNEVKVFIDGDLLPHHNDMKPDDTGFYYLKLVRSFNEYYTVEIVSAGIKPDPTKEYNVKIEVYLKTEI